VANGTNCDRAFGLSFCGWGLTRRGEERGLAAFLRVSSNRSGGAIWALRPLAYIEGRLQHPSCPEKEAPGKGAVWARCSDGKAPPGLSTCLCLPSPIHSLTSSYHGVHGYDAVGVWAVLMIAVSWTRASSGRPFVSEARG
jgi:hypothetical protein